MVSWTVIAVGALCGLLAGSPYAVALRIVKKSREASILPALVAACVSLVVLALLLVIGWAVLEHNALVAFVLVLGGMFLLTVIASLLVYGFKRRS